MAPRTPTTPPEPEPTTVGARLEGLLREVIDLAKDFAAKGERLDGHSGTLDEITVLLRAIKTQNEEAAKRETAEQAALRADQAERRDTIMRIVAPITTAVASSIATLIAAAAAYYFGIRPPVELPPPPPVEVHHVQPGP